MVIFSLIPSFPLHFLVDGICWKDELSLFLPFVCMFVAYLFIHIVDLQLLIQWAGIQSVILLLKLIEIWQVAIPFDRSPSSWGAHLYSLARKKMFQPH